MLNILGILEAVLKVLNLLGFFPIAREARGNYTITYYGYEKLAVCVVRSLGNYTTPASRTGTGVFLGSYEITSRCNWNPSTPSEKSDYCVRFYPIVQLGVYTDQYVSFVDTANIRAIISYAIRYGLNSIQLPEMTEKRLAALVLSRWNQEMTLEKAFVSGKLDEFLVMADTVRDLPSLIEFMDLYFYGDAVGTFRIEDARKYVKTMSILLRPVGNLPTIPDWVKKYL